ncbi:hypothetical protein M9H77_26984 [Catharanthus roseus]|uniref:Uncharacterized protein n=1 Tax=Catharanthus roseus TaxID=4058 RepID=A0ACC0AC77_CATRO|nr:hypothetical protein M9H77_26984 [Catharanthus roseus]
MELPSQEGEMPIPLNSTYGGHMIHHDHSSSTVVPSQMPNSSNNNGPISSNNNNLDQDLHHHNQNHHNVVVNFKKMVKYRECLKNHAAAMGGNATDGCGEFMPSGEEGTIEALTCSACNCHRNFHRKEIEGEPSSCDYCYSSPPHLNRINGRKLVLGHHHHHHKAILGAEPLGYPIPSRTAAPIVPHHPMIMSYNMAGSLPSESDEQEEGGHGGGGGHGGVLVRPSHHQLVKKRFRTKFSQEQKEKMLNFAEKVGWKIQKQEEGVVQQFCQEVGVKRRVLKVWMHNNKHNLAKKNNNNISINPQSQV